MPRKLRLCKPKREKSCRNVGIRKWMDKCIQKEKMTWMGNSLTDLRASRPQIKVKDLINIKNVFLNKTNLIKFQDGRRVSSKE